MQFSDFIKEGKDELNVMVSVKYIPGENLNDKKIRIEAALKKSNLVKEIKKDKSAKIVSWDFK